MSYAKNLKKRFQSITLNVEDLFLLESFQIKYLIDRVPKKEFTALLRANPTIHNHFVSIYPPIGGFISDLFKEYTTEENSKTIEDNCSDLLWEIADLIIYNKHPEIYDSNVEINWSINEIIPAKFLEGKIVAGFAGATADAFTLFEKFEEKLKTYKGNLKRAAVELAKDWRSDKILRRLEAMIIVADEKTLLVITGNGDVLEPDDDIIAIGSGGNYALAAARALKDGKLSARQVVKKSLNIAADICVYTNKNVTIEEV